MIDSVLKGTGNSRFLKSAVPAGTSWADALAMLQAGTFPIDFNGINNAGFQQVGTPLNKANLLEDATAAQIGLPPSTTPDGMFQALGNTGELHVWRKTVKNAEDVPAGYTLGDVQTGNFKFVADSYRTFEFGTPSVDDAGNVGLNVEGSVNGRYNSNFNNLKGKFCRPPDSTWYIDASLGSQVIYIPADATFSQSGSYKYVDKYQLVTGYPLTPAGTTTTYPVSTNPNAYQEGDDAKAAGYVVGEKKNVTINGMNGPILLTGNSLTVADDGTLSVTSPAQYGVYNSSTTEDVRSVVAGKYVYIPYNSGSVGFFKVPSDVIVTGSTAPDGGSVFAFTAQPVTGYPAIPAGTTIEYLGKLGDKARVQVLSYVGTGTYGSDHPNSLTFDFVPKMVIIYGGADRTSTYMSFTILSPIFNIGYLCNLVNYQEMSAYELFASLSGKTISFYSAYSGSYQSNASGYKYMALAIG